MKKTLAYLFLLLVFLFFQKAHATSTFELVSVFSESRQYDPVYYSFPEWSPWHDNYHYLMVAPAVVSIEEADDPTHPVYLDSDVTGNVELRYIGDTWGFFDHFSYGFFWDLNSAFPPPGETWEDEIFTFTIADTSKDWYVPSGSLRALTPPQVTITDTVHPTISWEPVLYADRYRVAIFPIVEGFTDLNNTLYLSDNLDKNINSFTYEGDIFTDGQEYGIQVFAYENHPFIDIDPDYSNGVINRSSYVTNHSAPVPEPATMLLLGSGLIGLAGFRRKMKNRRQ